MTTTKYLIVGGTIISGTERKIADIITQDDKIVSVGKNLQASDAIRVDASGKYIFPGFIDAHTHFDLEVSGTVTADDFSTGTKAAIVGGTTCVIDFATQNKKETLREALEHWHKKADERCSCDYAFHMAISDWNNVTSEEVEDMFARGVTSFKLYMTYDIRVSDGVIFEVLSRMKNFGGIVGVHCENGEIIDQLIARQIRSGNYLPGAHSLSRPAAVEAEAIQRLLTIARLVDIPVMIVHLSSAEGYDQVRQARERGQKVYVETCPQYLVLDDSLYDSDEVNSVKFICSPPLRKHEDQECLWRALTNNEINTIATDHCSFTMKQKMMGASNFTKIPNGMPGVTHRAHLLYTYGVLKEKITMEQMCALLSENPAKLYGMYPQKGCIAEGADADLVIWDPDYGQTITAEGQLYNMDYNPYEGTEVIGNAEMVFLRGMLVVQKGVLLKPNEGCYVVRKKGYL